MLKLSRKEYIANYRKTHKEEIRNQLKEYRKIHKEELKEKSRLYYLKTRKQRKLYDLKHKNRISKRHSEYTTRRLRTDINFRVLHSLRLRLWNALKSNIKSISTLKLLGCSVIQLKEHIESMFQTGMSWDNYGKYGWHIDHKIPCSKFDLSKISEQRKCFNFTNLQPLWAKDNLEKHDKITTD